MAISIVNQTAGFGGVTTPELLISPTAGNWLVAAVTWIVTDGSAPQICVGDYARNLWMLAYTATTPAYAINSGAQLYTQVWVCPNVQYPGWGQLGVYVTAVNISAVDVGNTVIEVYEVAGMGNGHLTVDSVVTGTAAAATSFSMNIPAPAGDCLMLSVVGVSTTGVVTAPSSPWTQLSGGVQNVQTPFVQLVVAEVESTTAQTAAWTSASATSWAGVCVAIRQTGVAPVQPNAALPAVEFQLGLGFTMGTPLNAVTWTTIPNRLLEWSTERGYQFELGLVQSSPTDLLIRNDDGAFTPRAAGAGTATGNGTTTTLLVSNADAASITVTDFFQLYSGGVLKETTVFQVQSLTVSGGTTTVLFVRADGGGSGALVATATGDVYGGCPIDIYVPYRVLATWAGKRYPVAAGWVERWPQTWRNPHWGDSPAVGIDAIATLTAADMTMVQGEILSRNPHSYWPLSDSQGVGGAQNLSGVGTAMLVPTVSKYGNGANGIAQFGASTQNLPGTGTPTSSLVGDPGTGWSQTGLVAAEYTSKGTALVAQDPGFPSIANGVTIFGVTATAPDESTRLSAATIDPTIFMLRATSGAWPNQIRLGVNSGGASTGYPYITVFDKTTHAATKTLLTGAANYWGVGNIMPWAVMFNQTSWTCYIRTTLAGSGSCNLGPNFGLIDIGGEADFNNNSRFWNSLNAHIAIFPRMLTQGEWFDLRYAVNLGNTTYSTTDAVIKKKLSYVNWRGPRVLTASNVNVGVDLLGSTIAEKVTSLADYEAGRMFADATGQLQFRSRKRSYFQTPRATLGDRPDLGEIPFLGEAGDFEIGYDPTYIYNSANVQNNGYTAAYSTRFKATSSGSGQKYGTRTLGKTISTNDDHSAFDLAWWYLGQFANPKLRLASVTVDAAKNGAQVSATWPFVLGVEVNDLITINKRPIGAPAISLSCVVLAIKHTIAPNIWTTHLTLAPAPPSVLIAGDQALGIVGRNAIGA